MRYSSGAHGATSITSGSLASRSLAPSGWFAVAIAATIASIVVSTIAWTEVGNGWAAGVVFLAVATAGGVLASRRGREAFAAFVGGSLVTIAGLYAALLVMAQVYAAVMD